MRAPRAETMGCCTVAVAVEGDDETYSAEFPFLCGKCGIPCEPIDPKDARDLEPSLSSKIIAAYRVDDATLDPFQLSLENMAHAQKLGGTLLCNTRVVRLETENRRIKRVHLTHMHTGEETVVYPHQVINAAGPWVGQVAALAGLEIDMLYSKGTLLVTAHRVTEQVVNRLRSPGDGDILVPGGTVSLLGTTSVRIDSPDLITPTIDEVDLIVDEGSKMIPTLKGIRYIRSYAGVRPLLNMDSTLDDRSVSRGFTLMDHARDGLENFATIPSGKLTTFRFMAEKTADLVCEKLGNHACRLHLPENGPNRPSGRNTGSGTTQKTPSSVNVRWCLKVSSRALFNPSMKKTVISACRRWACEAGWEKGPARGHSVENGCRPLQGRWTGERPVLWHSQMMQAELKEALYCGAFNLETRERRRKR